ncbi:MAG: hypothetical protein RR510_16530 [Morganella sp. (in: enterobacteria)]
MLVFNCTKAAAEFFTVTRHGKKHSPLQAPQTDTMDDYGTETQPISQWLVHAIKVKRKHILIAMHVHTRYAMVFCDLKKADKSTFLTLFMERLFNGMLFFAEEFALCDESKFRQIFAEFDEYHRDIYFCLRGDRSVQGHINDVAWQFENAVNDAGCLPDNYAESASFDEWQNASLRSARQSKDYFFPDETMFTRWFARYSGRGNSDEAVILRSFDALRRRPLSYAESDEDSYEESHDKHHNDLIPDNVIDLAKVRAERNKR